MKFYPRLSIYSISYQIDLNWKKITAKSLQLIEIPKLKKRDLLLNLYKCNVSNVQSVFCMWHQSGLLFVLKMMVVFIGKFVAHVLVHLNICMYVCM